jgi:hypothetical protein
MTPTPKRAPAKKNNHKHNQSALWSILVVMSLSATTFLLNQIQDYTLSLNIVETVNAQTVNATLSLTPSSTSVGLNQNFTVNINLNTAGAPVDGVDIYRLRFTPSILQVVDSNSGVAGVQIAPGSLMPNTAINSVDNTAGTIQFSQSTTGGSNFSGSGVLASVTFRGNASGTSPVTFDFTSGSTADTNVAFQGVDRLSSVTNGSYVVDGTAPTVTMSAPTSGANVSGSVTVSATASDNVGVAGVQFRLDGVNLGAEDTSSPYSITWDTTTSTNASHTLTAVARDAVGNTTTSLGRTVTVNNADTTSPTASITAPASGASVNGTISVTASASDNIGVSGVQFRLDGANLGSEDTASPYTISWNTTTATNGSHTLSAVARDAAGNTGVSTGISVTVNNADTTSPTVSVTVPTSGATVSGSSITLSATASDNIGVVGVRFRIDGANVGTEDTSSPYSITWNSTTVTNGSHTVSAVARDAAGNTTTSSNVTITVNNAPANQLPNGNIDEVNTSGVIRGWSYDPDSSASSNQVRIYVDGPAGTGTLIGTVTANIDRPDIRSTFGITGNHGFTFNIPTAYKNGAYHTVYAVGVDFNDTAQSVQLPGSGQSFVTKTIHLTLEGRTSSILSGTLSVMNLSRVSLTTYSFTTDSSGNTEVTLQTSPQSVFFRITAAPFLSRMATVDLNSAVSTINMSQMWLGDINQDNIVNSVDFSVINTNWFTSNTTADLNRDGLVNAIDFSYLNLHWLVTGEQ